MLNSIPFEIMETPVLYDVNGNVIQSEKYKMLYRSDDGSELYSPKSSYVPMLNSHFMETTQRMSEISGFELSGYSLFHNGVIVLAFLKNNQEDIHVNGTKIKDYLMLGSSCNTRWPFFIGTTSELIRCQNQFSRINRVEKVRHTKSAPKKIDDLLKSLEVYFQERKEMYYKFEKMYEYEIDIQIKQEALAYIMKLNKQEMLDGSLSDRKMKHVDTLSLAMNGEIGVLGKNLWGMFNGVTLYSTHLIKSKNQVFGNVFGTASDINKRAMDFCLDLVN